MSQNLARQNRAAQIALDRATLRQLTDDYMAVWRSVRADLDDLTHQIAEARQAGKTISPSWLYRQERYKALLAGIQQRVGSYTDAASQRIYSEMLRAYGDGGRDAMALLRASLPEGVSFAFTAPPLAALEELSRARLTELMKQYGRDAALKVRPVLLNGLARGQSPAVIAARIRDVMGGPLNKALTVARTETMQAYRRASQATYQANGDVLDGWRWLAAATASDYCADNNGKVFPLEQDMASMVHPRCRCTGSPVVRPLASILESASIPALAG